jgi:hypothetical protein
MGFKYDVLFYPGKTMSDNELNQLTYQLRNVAKSCFEEVPNYQVLTGKREEFERAVISVAKNNHGD